MTVARASEMLLKGQVPILESLQDYLRGQGFSDDDLANSLSEKDSDALF